MNNRITPTTTRQPGRVARVVEAWDGWRVCATGAPQSDVQERACESWAEAFAEAARLGYTHAVSRYWQGARQIPRGGQ